MPQMGVSVSEGTITKWLKQVGEHIDADESLLEISTDKVDTEVPSPASGVLAEILVQEGATVEVGTKLALIAPVSGESVYSEFLDAGGSGLHHVCIEAPDSEAFDTTAREAEGNGTPVVAQGIMPGGMRFAYRSADDAGVPYIEIAVIPGEIKEFFDYVKQEQQ